MYGEKRYRTLSEGRAEIEILIRNILRRSDNMEQSNETPVWPDGFDTAIILAVTV